MNESKSQQYLVFLGFDMGVSNIGCAMNESKSQPCLIPKYQQKGCF